MNADLVRQQPFISYTRTSGFAYFRISKSMMQLGHVLGIDSDEILLYTLLRDRALLSLANKNYDEDGKIFVFCTRPNAATYFGWSTRKTVTLFHALVEHHLIVEQPMFDSKGRQKATRLYLNTWSVPSPSFTQEEFDNLLFPAMTVKTLAHLDIGDYYIFPKILLEDERYHGLSLRSMLLYTLLLDRITLSERYHRVDDTGSLWTTMDSSIISQELGCSQRSLSRATAELENITLIERHAVSHTEKWRIYVRDYLPASISCTDEKPAIFRAIDDSALAFAEELSSSDANFTPLGCQDCIPKTPKLQSGIVKSTPPVMPDLHPIKLSSIKNTENNLSTTSIPIHLEAISNETSDTSMYVFEQKRTEALKSLEFQYQSMEFCHYSEAVDICYTRFSESEADYALQILDFAVDVIKDILASPLPYQQIGRDSVKTCDVLTRFRELNEYIMFLLIEKMLPRWDEIKDKTAYMRRTLYLGSRQHRQEAFFLQKRIENEFLEIYSAVLPY